MSPTARTGRNTLSRFSPTHTQMYHGMSQISPRISADFYNKIDQCGTKKRSPNSSTNPSPTFIDPQQQRPSSTDLPYGNLCKPSSMQNDPLSPSQVLSSEQIYEHVNHPIGYSMQKSQRKRDVASEWETLITSEPCIARHNICKERRQSRETNCSSNSNNSNHSNHSNNTRISTGSAAAFRPVRKADQYAWEGPQDATLDTALWRSPPPTTQEEKDIDAVQESFKSQCFTQSNMNDSQEREERRRQHLEVRRKRKKKNKAPAEASMLKVVDPIIHHDDAAGERIGANNLMIWSVGPSGNATGFLDDKKSSSDRLSQRKSCDKNTGTYRSKKWGAGGGYKSEPLGDNMNPGSNSISAEMPNWITSNREQRVPDSLVHQKDRQVRCLCVVFTLLLTFFWKGVS